MARACLRGALAHPWNLFTVTGTPAEASELRMPGADSDKHDALTEPIERAALRRARALRQVATRGLARDLSTPEGTHQARRSKVDTRSRPRPRPRSEGESET